MIVFIKIHIRYLYFSSLSQQQRQRWENTQATSSVRVLGVLSLKKMKVQFIPYNMLKIHENSFIYLLSQVCVCIF